VLLTFGLLSPNKGLEVAISALPQIVATQADALYVIAGATHPNLVRDEGEKYRYGLQKLAHSLGVEKHVQFVNKFLARDELLALIDAADIYLTPYLNEAQITSGTLAYAFGLGKPVISTPYWHAAELLANDAGVLVPFNDPRAIAEAVEGLFADAFRLQRMARAAAAMGKTMQWDSIAKRYVSLFTEVVEKHERSSVRLAPMAWRVATPAA
jgi:glycosyltransferase involved in cell wall biosynthesis